MSQMSFDDLMNKEEIEYNKNKWYALCEYKGKGKNKRPYQIQASQYIEKLEDRMVRLQDEHPDREYAIKTTLQFDKEINGINFTN